jgi:3-methyl-2-oxobutanoate hydroxymethyltransferase
MGHLGLTPQSIHQLGGFRTQGKTAAAAQRLVADALSLQEAGCFSLVLESVPAQLAGWISKHLQIPVIGIGAGADCDGQVLVTHDVLGLFDRFTPRFARQYTNLFAQMSEAFQAYIDDVKDRSFPAEDHKTEMADSEWEGLMEMMGEKLNEPV